MKTQPYTPEYLGNALINKRNQKNLLGVTLSAITQGFYYAYAEEEYIVFFTKHFCAN